MSREIKFRAWHKNANYMCQNATTDLLDRDYLEFMQYTGLKDKNEKEIYEGDIVKIKHFARYNSELNSVLKISNCEVIYENCQFLFHDTYKDDFKYKFNDIDCIKNIEVIGNIYEEPNLLKED